MRLRSRRARLVALGLQRLGSGEGGVALSPQLAGAHIGAFELLSQGVNRAL